MASGRFSWSNEELSIMSTFAALSNVPIVDCVIDDRFNRVIIVVDEGYISAAIGKEGEHVKHMARFLQKEIEIVEYSESPEEFIKKMFLPARVERVEIKERRGKKLAIVYVVPSQKKIAIGKGGKTIARARLLAARHLGIQNVFVN